MVFAILMVVFQTAAFADSIDLVNNYGSISISTNGIMSNGSQLVAFDQLLSKPGHAMGVVSFTTGALVKGSINAGGVFSSTGSTFTVIGKGNYGEPKGLIFAGSFVGNINWIFEGRTHGVLEYVLLGSIRGMLYNGRMVTGRTIQTIYTSPGQLSRGVGHLGFGHVAVGSHLTPEPDSSWLLTTGLVLLLLVAFRHRSTEFF